VLNNPTTFVDPLGLDCSQVQSGTDENGDPIFTMNCTSSAPASPDYPFLWLFCSLGFGSCGGSNVGLSFPTAAPPQSTGGGGGAGSGAGSSPPPPPKPPAPNPPKPPLGPIIAKVNRCAANVANSFSVASLTGLDNNPLTAAIFSNNVASVSNLIFSQSPSDYVPAGTSLVASRYAGTTLVKGAQVAAAVETNQGFQSILTTIAPTTLGQTAAGKVAVGALEFGGELLNASFGAQIGYDAAVYFGSLVACTQ
jgi:hypothetical protein